MMDIEAVRALSAPRSRITYLGHFDGGDFFANNSKTYPGLPPFTRARFVMRPGKGSYIVTEVWLPDDTAWNGRFVGIGNGGMAGSIRYERLAKWISLGYACANTDLGTSRGELSGAGNPDVWADFGWRATHLMTVAAKKAIRAYYGKNAAKSYFIGSSTGGEQAFAEAERFPEDYDGISAGVAAMNRTALHIYFLWAWRNLRRDGAPVFTPEEAEKLGRLCVRFFRENGDGEPGDPFISLPWLGEDTVERLIAYLSEQVPELTDGQKDALYRVYDGPRNPRTGERIYCGMPIASGTWGSCLMSHAGEKCPFLYPFRWAFGADYDVHSFDFDRDADRLQAMLGPDMNANNADLSAFAAHGGKLITFSGSADHYVPYPETAAFTDRAAALCGGYRELGKFYRFYLLPGRAHHGGPGAEEFYLPGDEGGMTDAFAALVRWVEEGTAPEEMTAVSAPNEKIDGKKEFTRTVFPYGVSERCSLKPGESQPGCARPF